MAVWEPDRDTALRIAAMAYINRVTDQSGGAITRAQLEALTFQGQAIKLIDPSRGIRNPAMLPATLSILTNPRSGYQDHAGPDGFPRYSIRTGSRSMATTVSHKWPNRWKPRSSGSRRSRPGV